MLSFAKAWKAQGRKESIAWEPGHMQVMNHFSLAIDLSFWRPCLKRGWSNALLLSKNWQMTYFRSIADQDFTECQTRVLNRLIHVKTKITLCTGIYIYFKIFRDPCQISSVLPNGKNLIPKCVLKKITLTLTIFVITPMRLQDLEAHLRAEISWKLYALHFNFKKI